MENINHPHHRSHYKQPAEQHCDFCNSLLVRWLYLTRAFTIVIGELVMIISPNWATCDECRVLIEAKDTHKMLKRMARGFQVDLKANPLLKAFMWAEFEGFLEVNTAPPVLFMPGGPFGNN